MIVVSKEQVKDRLQDGIDTIMAVNDEEFNVLLERLSDGERMFFYYTTDDCEMPQAPKRTGVETNIDSRGYYGGTAIEKREFFDEIEKRGAEKDATAQTRARAAEIINVCGLKNYMKACANHRKFSVESVKRAFNVLLDEKVLYEFMQTAPSMDEVVVDGETYDKREVFEVLGSTFRHPEVEKFASFYTESKQFILKDEQKLIDNYTLLFNSAYNLDMYALREYTFKTKASIKGGFISRVEDKDWTPNEQLSREVWGDMPKGLTAEEQAVYVYTKLCSLLCYDDGVISINGERVSKLQQSYFNKERLESVKPNGKVVCYDFARICTKFLNQIDGATAYTLEQGMVSGHFLVGCYTDKMSTYFEAINVTASSGLNDLMRAQNKMELEGFNVVSDKYGAFKAALNKVYPLVYNEKQKTAEELAAQIDEEKLVGRNFEESVRAIVDVLKQNHLYGNEATLTFNFFKKKGYFDKGKKVESAYIGELCKNGKRDFYKRKILVREEGERDPYLIDVVNLECAKLDFEDVKNKLQSKEYVFEDDVRVLRDLEVEEKR